ncbi:ABC transporter ATP-binding protein [Paenibacillus senegalensis]|uniref:ABC transporter ATP-binding protein n=1 Tax=Paenibacillus senegalensis TaxID=1465766 RepID=UPI000287DB7E|nr:ABC transporter ATP-binding protein [Paenibacillus senegalensis]
MLQVFSYLKPYRKPMIIAISLMLMELAVELIHPLLIAKIIDDGIIQQDMSVVWYWGGIMLLLTLLGFAAGIINSFYAATVSQGFAYDIRESMFGRIQSFSFANFDRFATSSLITRITSDVTQMQNVVFMGLRIMLRAPLMLMGGLIMAMVINVKLGLILLVTMPFLFGFLVWVMNRGFKLFRAVQARLDRTNGVLRENLMGMRLIKAFVRSKHEMGRFSKANGELRDKTIAALRLIELAIPILLLVMNFSILFILWFGNNQVNAANADIGQIVAVVNYATRITGAFTALSFILASISRARASAQRVGEVLATEEDMVEKREDSSRKNHDEGEIVFDNVTFQYPRSQSPAIDAVSFRVRSGQTVAILGATGSGKSTLFQLIPRLYDPQEGRILINGTDVRELTYATLRRQIGYVPQESLLFTGTVQDNIRWGKEGASAEEVREAAANAQIHETIMKLPKQYETLIGQKGVNLSGGQKQRMSIARALIRKPRFLLFDDSTSALDLATEAKLLQALKKYDCTTLIITQKISTAIEADTVLLMEDGRLLAQGTHDELLASSSLYRQIVESQFGKEGTSDAKTAR